MGKEHSIKLLVILPAMLLLFQLPATAQPVHYQQIDSLQQLLKSKTADTARARVLTTLGQYYFPINPDSGFAYAHQALDLTRRIDWKKGEVLALKAIGSNYWAKADFLKCQDYFLQARDVALQLNDPAMLSIAYHAVAISYLPLGNTEKGIEYLQKALSIEQRSKDPNRLMAIYHNLGDIYEGKKDYWQAVSYYEKSLPAAIDAKYGRGIAHTYLKLGTLNVALNALQKGFGYLQNSLSLSRTLNEQPITVTALLSCGEVHRQEGRYNQAIAYYDSALAVSATFKAAHYIGLHGTYLFSTAHLYLEKAQTEKKARRLTQAHSDYRQAIAYLKKALQVSGSVYDWVAMRDEAQLLSDIYQEMGQPEKALQTYKDYITYRDSVINIDKAKETVQHEVRVTYEDSLQYIKNLQGKQLQILAQGAKLEKYKTNQLLLFAAIAISTLSLVAAVFFYRYRLQKIRFSNALQTDKMQKGWREAELQHKLNDMTLAALHSQMNPHFIFNALNTIKSFIYTDNKLAATTYLGKFSELMRNTLDYSRRQTISLEEEMEIIRLYLSIEEARFDGELKIEIIVDETLPLTDIELPPLFVQPYVENALKHGLLHKHGEKQLKIEVQMHEQKHAILIKVDDNGVGRKQSSAINKIRLHHHSFANEANERRADLMRELWGKKITVQIKDKVSAEGLAEGTMVLILISIESIAYNANV